METKAVRIFEHDKGKLIVLQKNTFQNKFAFDVWYFPEDSGTSFFVIDIFTENDTDDGVIKEIDSLYHSGWLDDAIEKIEEKEVESYELGD